jgi:predicted CXXCH cytochrome family protein
MVYNSDFNKPGGGPKMRHTILFVLALLLVPVAALAAGGHDALSCTGCHSIHDVKGDIIFAVGPNTASLNPKDNKPFGGVTALCLGCHETTGGMGIMPVTGKKSHPYGLKPNPKVASVPKEVLRGGKLGCVGCHDPHPSNPNHKYLKVATSGGSKMQVFCSLCHSSKSGIKVKSSQIFDSMDERKGKAGPKKPAPKKK